MIPYLFSPINSSKSPSLLQRSLLLATTTFDFFPFSQMESFALLKFWKTSTARVSAASAADKCLMSVSDGREEEEEEESFFELEFTLPDYGEKSVCKEEKIGRIGDFISDEKADARIGAKPQSPMSILRKSAPKLRVFMLGKLIRKSKPEKASQSQSVSAAAEAPKAKTKINFTVKMRIEDATVLKKKFSRSDSSSIAEKRSSREIIDGASRRFSKDSVNKYLNLIKKRPSDQKDPFDCAGTASFVSPRKSGDRASSNSRFRAPCKNLGKSRSAGALDDSLAQQNDGIQGAILHCKQSFSSSFSER